MLKVEVALFATLRRYHPEAQDHKKIEMEMEPGTTVRQLLDHLGIPREEVKMFFVNHRRAEEGQQLEDGDSVGIFPPIAGG